LQNSDTLNKTKADIFVYLEVQKTLTSSILAEAANTAIVSITPLATQLQLSQFFSFCQNSKQTQTSKKLWFETWL